MKVYGKWTVTLPGESYIYDPDNMLGSVWAQMENDLGITYQEFNRGLAGVNKTFRPCQWLIWYLRRQAGRDEDLLAVDFPLIQMQLEEIEEGEAPAADTPPSGLSILPGSLNEV